LSLVILLKNLFTKEKIEFVSDQVNAVAAKKLH